MSYKLKYSEKAFKQLKKMDHAQAKMILKWLDTNINGVSDPRSKGKALTGNKIGQWRYRIGDYRALVKIQDDKLIILVLEMGHRKNIYK